MCKYKDKKKDFILKGLKGEKRKIEESFWYFYLLYKYYIILQNYCIILFIHYLLIPTERTVFFIHSQLHGMLIYNRGIIIYDILS